MTIILANFGFPLSVEHKNQLAEILEVEHRGNLDIREEQASFSPSQSFVRQAKRLVAKLKVTKRDLEDGQLIVMLPGHPSAAVAIVVELWKKLGLMPPCVRLVRVSRYPPRFEVAEIMRFDE